MKTIRVLFSLLCPWSAAVLCASPAIKDTVFEMIEADLARLTALYKHFHANPELSLQEEQSARRLAAELREAGFDVTERVGGHGVVGVLRNGEGPTILIRGDMDALPIQEQTGLPHASTARAIDSSGNEVPVMHACGHDVHMTVVAGAARVMSNLRGEWSGTLVAIGQPAEEIGVGARAMIADGLFTRFPVPDKAIALHVSADMAVGTVGYTPGHALANVDTVDLTIRGVGGHGAHPHNAKDPIVLAAQTVLALQTIVSRELVPLEPAVVTVGAIRGGTKHNIIPDKVELQLTVRSYTDEVRSTILGAIERIARGIAMAGGVPDDLMPLIKVHDTFIPAVYNDPELMARLTAVFAEWLGPENVVRRAPVMGGEDFGEYGRTAHRVPTAMYRLGTIPKERLQRAAQTGETLPSLHSPFYHPEIEPSLRYGVATMTAAVIELMKGDGR